MEKFYKRMLGPLLILMLVASNVYAQTTISGTVKDQNGEPLAGVNIVVKGTVHGTLTNSSGEFSISVKQALPFTVSVSIVGYKSQEIEVTQAANNLDIKLDEGILLNETTVHARPGEDNRL